MANNIIKFDYEKSAEELKLQETNKAMDQPTITTLEVLVSNFTTKQRIQIISNDNKLVFDGYIGDLLVSDTFKSYQNNDVFKASAKNNVLKVELE